MRNPQRASGRDAGGHLPVASQAQLVRASEKDAEYEARLQAQVNAAASSLLGARIATPWREETSALARLCYHVVSRSRDGRTLGEEDCDLLPAVVGSWGRPGGVRLGTPAMSTRSSASSSLIRSSSPPLADVAQGVAASTASPSPR